MARPTRRDIPKTRAEGAAAISDQCAHVPWVDSPTLGLLTLARTGSVLPLRMEADRLHAIATNTSRCTAVPLWGIAASELLL